MVQANELRIGNWVIFNDNTDRFGRVIGINSYDTVHIDCNYTPEHNECFIRNIALHCDFIHPIPLTPEILEKAAFKKGEEFHNDFGIKHCWYLSIKMIDFEVLEYKDGKFGVELNDFLIEPLSVHQLQNLYFALTGEELQIEL